MRNTFSVFCSATTETPKALAIAGMPGKYASMLSGPSAVNAPKKKMRYQGGGARVAPQRAGHERVLDLAGEQQTLKIRDWHEHDLGDLAAGVLNGALRLDVGRVEAMQAMREQRGVRIQVTERLRAARAIAGLLEALAQGGGGRILSGIDEPARHLERDALRAVAVLANEHGFVVARDRQQLRPVHG